MSTLKFKIGETVALSKSAPKWLADWSANNKVSYMTVKGRTSGWDAKYKCMPMSAEDNHIKFSKHHNGDGCMLLTAAQMVTSDNLSQVERFKSKFGKNLNRIEDLQRENQLLGEIIEFAETNQIEDLSMGNYKAARDIVESGVVTTIKDAYRIVEHVKKSM